ncbi:MAG: PAS domain S-box protein, partial [Bacteroidota bacterium]|nr:PAS domain S-box protein [Bacteroidota bacterium]
KKQEEETQLLASNLHTLYGQLEKKLLEKTEDLRVIFEHITDGVVVFDHDWICTYVNAKGAEAVNASPEMLIGKKVWQLFPDLIGSSLYNTYLKSATEQIVIRTIEYVEQSKKWFEGVMYPSERGLVAYFQDVTDRKNAEIDLEKSEALYRTIVETAHEGILQIDEHNIITFTNSYAASILGQVKNEIEGRNVLDIVGEHNIEIVMQHINRKKEGGTKQYELEIFDTTGKSIIVLIRSHPLFTAGKYSGFIATIVDITQSKQAEKKLLESENRFKSLFHHSQDGIALLSREAVILEVSPAVESILGLTKEQLVNTSRLDFVSPEFVGLIHQTFSRVIKDSAGPETIEYKAILADGSRKWIECTFSNLLHESSVNAVVLNFRDITARKKSEQQIIESEKRYRQIVETAQEGIWMMDADLKTTYVNQKLCELFEYTQEEMLGKTNYSFRRNFELSDILKRRELRKQGVIETHESEFVSKSGRSIYTKVSTNPIFSEDGSFKGSLAMVADISDLKKAEREKEFERRNKEALINSTEDLIWSVSSDFKLIAANKAFLKQMFTSFDIQLKEGDSLMFNEHITEPFLAFWQQLYKRALSGEIFTEEIFSPPTPNFTNTWVEIIFNPIYEEDKVVAVACFSRNITEKKLAIVKLEESEAFLAEAQRLAKMGSWNFDFIKNKLTWSEELYRVIGTDKETFKETHNSFIDLVMEEDKERVLQTSLHAQKTGNPFIIDYNIITSDGETRAIQEIGFGEKDAEGHVIRLFGTAQDVTEQKKAEQKILITEGQLKIIYNNVSDLIFLLSIEDKNHFKFVSVNQVFLKATGLHEDKVIGKYVHEVIPTSSIDHFLDKYQSAIDNQKTVSWEEKGEYLSKLKIGHITISPVLDKKGKPILLVGSVHDITDQKNAEQRIIESEEKYRLLFEKSPLPMWIFETQTLTFLEVNPAAIEHYGFSREEFLKMNLSDIRPQNKNFALTELNNNNYRISHSKYSIHRKKNGRLTKVQVSASAITFENKPARLALLTDLTEQEKVKDHLIATTQQLRELASHLQNIREDERTSMAREIHDELGQQLTALKMDIAWLHTRVKNGDETIAFKIKSSLQLIDGTINTVRKIASELRPGVLDDLGLSDAIDWHGREFSKRTMIRLEFSSDVPEIMFPPRISTALFRIFQEALTNVARHSGATVVTSSLKNNDNQLILTISDNGVGFDLNKLNNKKTLGILGMQERVVILNGKYDISSHPGKGTIVTVSIPLVN